MQNQSSDSDLLIHSVRAKAFQILFLVAFTTQLGIGIISPALPLYAQVLGVGGFALGLITSSFAIGRTLFMPLGGTLSDSWGRKRLLLIGLIGYSIFSGCYVFSFNLESLLLFRFLHGLSAALVFPIATAYVGDCCEEGCEAKTMGTFHSSAFLGMSFGPLIGGVFFQYIGYDTPFIALCILAGMNVILVWKYLPDYKAHTTHKFSFIEVFRDASLKIPLLFYFTYNVIYATYISYFSAMLLGATGLTAAIAGGLMSLTAISMALFQRKIGVYVDKSAKNIFLALGMAVTGISMCLLVVPTTLSPFVLLCIIMGSGFGLSLTTVSAMTTIAGRRLGQGKSSSGVNTAQSLGLMIAPPIIGFLCGTDYEMVFLCAGILCILTVPFWYVYGK